MTESELQNDLEMERMCLAACSTAALGYFQDRPRLLGRTAETFAEWGRSFMGEWA